MIRLQNLNEYQIILAHILDIMRHSFGDVATIARVKIECPGKSLRCIYTNSCTPSHEECPLITSSVPMYFAHSARMNSHNCCRELLGDGEFLGVKNFDCSTGSIVSQGSFREMVRIRKFLRQDTSRSRDVLLSNICGSFCAGKDEEFPGRDVGPGRCR